MVERLRIAFIADCLEGRGGGVVSGRRFVARLREQHDVTVVSGDPPREGNVALPCLGSGIKRMREMGFVFAWPKRTALRDLFAHVDVVHLQYPFWLSFAALEEAHAAGVPVVGAFHVQPENLLRNIPTRSRWARDAIYRLWIDRLYNQCDAVVCPTPFAEQKLRDHGLTTPVTVISNGTQTRALPRIQRDDDAISILMVGRLAREKRQDLLLGALHLMRHRSRVRLILAGSGPQEAALRRLAAGLPNKIDIGFVPQDRLDVLLASCDLFVHCSEVELEGMAVLDAMNAGCAVVVAESSESASSSLALDARFSFPAGDAAALAQRLDALIEQPELRRTAGLAYKSLARTFSFDDSVAKLIATYRSVWASSRRTVESPWLIGTRTELPPG